jgi:integrase
MGRPRKGWTIRQRPGRPCEVRFTHEGHEYNLETGPHDREEAAREAERIYADTIRGTIQHKRQPKVSTAMSLADAGAEWLAASVGRLRINTAHIYETVYLTLLAKHFPTLADCTTQNMERFVSARLSSVQAQTLRKNISVLRLVLQFSHGKGWIRDLPTVPSVPKRAKGTRFAKRRRVAADPLSPDEIEALLAALPEWSTSKKVKTPFPVRARFVVGYDQAMRPELLNRLEVPLNWSPGRRQLWIPGEHDKCSVEGYAPLTDRALAALESVAPETGLIFGKHDYREALKKAADKALPPHKAERFCGQHLRSAGLTHLVEFGNLVGAQAVGRHKHVSTTARYVRSSERAAAEVIEMASRKRRSG